MVIADFALERTGRAPAPKEGMRGLF